MTPPGELLSGRQLEAARLAADGLGHLAIARRMRIKPGTAKAYLQRARHATGTRNRYQLARWIRENDPHYAGPRDAVTAARGEISEPAHR